jgi:hypothetical protein
MTKKFDRLITISELSRCSACPSTPCTGGAPRRGPAGYRIGRHVRYRRAAVEAWNPPPCQPQPSGGRESRRLLDLNTRPRPSRRWHQEFCILQIRFPDLVLPQPAPWPDLNTAESGSL